MTTWAMGKKQAGARGGMAPGRRTYARVALSTGLVPVAWHGCVNPLRDCAGDAMDVADCVRPDAFREGDDVTISASVADAVWRQPRR